MMIEKTTAPLTISQKDLDKLAQSWIRMVSNISHHLTTPLVTLRMSGEFLQKTFPDLLAAYRTAVKHTLIVPTIDERYLKASEKFITDIANEVNEMLEFLNLLRPYNQKLVSNPETPTINLNECIASVIKNYPFADENERKLVRVDAGHEIVLQWDSTFIEYLLNHLLNNALRCIKEVGKGEISIWTEENAGYAILHVKDTSKGMDEHKVASIFHRFFSKRDGKIIPGLGFCKLALTHMGGDIVCESKLNEYTHFVIKIPNPS